VPTIIAASKMVGTSLRAFAHPTGFAISTAGCYGEAMSARRSIIGISGPASA